MPNSSVNLEIDGKIFTFNEGTLALEAYNSIFEEFKQYTTFNLISIFNNTTHQKVNNDYKLKGNEKYTVCIKFSVNFRNKANTSHNMQQIFNYSDKVKDAINTLSMIYSIDQFNIVIYDKDQNEITDENKFLREICNSNREIFFTFKQKSSKKYSKKEDAEDESPSATIKYCCDFDYDDDEIKEIKTEKGETAQKLKEKISKIYDIINLSDIKIFFAGKEISDDTILSDLKIGSTVLFVHIKSDKLLLTKKSLGFT